MSFLLRTFIALSLLTITLVVGRFAVADFYYERANTLYKSELRSDKSNIDTYDLILKDIDRSLYWHDNSAEALDLKAHVLFQSWWLSPDGQYLSQSIKLQGAEENHLKALRFRPKWSYAAAQLALIYSHQATLDTRFDYWFDQAFKLGRYETSIARSMMNLGFIHWHKVTELQKNNIFEFTRISIEQKSNSKYYIKELLAEYSMSNLVCQELEMSARISAVCN